MMFLGPPVWEMLKSADAPGSPWAWKRWGMGCARAHRAWEGCQESTLALPGEVAPRPDGSQTVSMEWCGLCQGKRKNLTDLAIPWNIKVKRGFWKMGCIWTYKMLKPTSAVGMSQEKGRLKEGRQ